MPTCIQTKLQGIAVIVSIIGLISYPSTGQTQDAGAAPTSYSAAGNNAPHLKDSLNIPIVTAEGHTAMLTCVVRNLGDHVLLWKYGDKILTAGGTRVTTDKRYNVIHDEGGDVYVLTIKATTHRDSGLYVCEIDTKPTLKSFHKLTVLTSKLVAPPPRGDTGQEADVSNTTTPQNLWGYSTPSPIDHDYTYCCSKKKVKNSCIGFCDINNILKGTTGAHPSECEEDFPKIVECMAAGRNHVPCCERAGVPDLCQDMCTGSYTVQTDDARSQVSCSAYTAPTLVCIAEGVNILPPRPQEIKSTNITDTSFTVKWKTVVGEGASDASSFYQASFDSPPVTSFYVNVTKVRSMIPDGQRPHIAKVKTFKERQHKVPGKNSTITIDGLDPYTVYNVTSVTAENSQGRSLPSYSLLVLTLSKREARILRRNQRKKDTDLKEDGTEEDSSSALEKKIPDTRQCCKNRHIHNNSSRMIHEGCVDRFCDPVAIREIKVTDFMICATWTWDMFSCLVDGKNHEPCCKRRGVPDICSNFCSANTSADNISFRHFKCESYMEEISNCLMEGYDVLPSAPQNFYFSNIGSTIGLLHWDPPLLHGDSVTNYRVHYDESTLYPFSNPIDKEMVTVRKTGKSPYILEGLKPGTSYIAYVEAENKYGTGLMSSIAVFRTAMKSSRRKKKNNIGTTGDNFFKQRECCTASGVKNACLSMCQYNASISESRRLAPLCKEDFPLITKCAAAGRDHLPCCVRRGVPVECQALCQGTQMHSQNSVYGDCFAYIGNIMTCLEEGWINLPEPVKNFHATLIEDTKITLSWDPVKVKDKSTEDSEEMGNVLQYELFYKELENNSIPVGGAFTFDKNINVTAKSYSVKITGLTTNKMHQFFIVSRNALGTSLPTSVITVNISRAAWDGQLVHGRPSPPHEVATTTGADYITVSWTPPTISDPESYHKYRLSYGRGSKSRSTLFKIETSANSATISNLTSNTQYIIHLNTIRVLKNNTIQVSTPSETIVVWTDPTIRAIAEPPKVSPNEIREGDNFQILCIGLGTPIPTVSLYLDGHIVRSGKVRHLVTTIHNASRILTSVGCSASNGEGNADYSEKNLDIRYHPTITHVRQQNTFQRNQGQMHSIICGVEANPAPKIAFGRTNGKDIKVNARSYGEETYDAGKTVDLSNQLRHNLYIRQPQYVTLDNGKQVHKDDYYEAVLTIRNFQPSDSGGYYCTAENDIGQNNINITVEVNLAPALPRHEDLRSCCKNEGIQDDTCLDICTFKLDLDLLAFEESTGCSANYFSTYMKCGADKSDHRQCCRNNKVPRGCWDFCRGRTPSVEVAAATGLINGPIDDCMPHMKSIGKCFQEGQYTLPGPPTNLKVKPIDASSAVATWDPPIKNPSFAEVYRIIWRKPGERAAQKLDTPNTTVTLKNLTPSVQYELVVKAGNSNGTSVLSTPITFVVADKFIIKTSENTDIVFIDTTALIGGLLTVAVILVFALLTVMWYKGHPLFSYAFCPNIVRRPWISNWRNSSGDLPENSPTRSFANNMFHQEISMSNLEDTLSDAYVGPHNDPPPYYIESAEHNITQRCETTDNSVDETSKETTRSSTSTKLAEKLGGFRRNGASKNGDGFQRFQ